MNSRDCNGLGTLGAESHGQRRVTGGDGGIDSQTSVRARSWGLSGTVIGGSENMGSSRDETAAVGADNRAGDGSSVGDGADSSGQVDDLGDGDWTGRVAGIGGAVCDGGSTRSDGMDTGDGHSQGSRGAGSSSGLISSNIGRVHVARVVVVCRGKAGEEAERNSSRLHFDGFDARCRVFEYSISPVLTDGISWICGSYLRSRSRTENGTSGVVKGVDVCKNATQWKERKSIPR